MDSLKLKEFADDSFKFDENYGNFSKRLENTVGKGEIARYEQFLLFPLCFQTTCIEDTYQQGFVWERVNSYPAFYNHIFHIAESQKEDHPAHMCSPIFPCTPCSSFINSLRHNPDF